jgi:hypothetical protein
LGPQMVECLVSPISDKALVGGFVVEGSFEFSKDGTRPQRLSKMTSDAGKAVVVGPADGLVDGRTLGLSETTLDGEAVVVGSADVEGEPLGKLLKLTDGSSDGLADGIPLGFSDNTLDGEVVVVGSANVEGED